MNFLRTVVAVVLAGAFLTSCDSARVAPASTEGGAVITPQGTVADESLYPPGFDPSSYAPPDHWQEACKKAYTRFAVPLLAGWNSIRGLLEGSKYSSYHSKTLKVVQEMLTEPSWQKRLKACRQADPVIGNRFERGLAGLQVATGIVCQGEEARLCGTRELTAAERTVLARSSSQVLAALPPKRWQASANAYGHG
ncbi:hypothetical protein [Streptosporangium saharense]|uniref:hypothetical protein n=1 Tax=Streptosporangium saharense TaxID=1706840 RepID=UPI0033196A03